ncbi:MAG: carboxypeptidase-like regulatory domain-containing protein [Haliscomenobacter sp.]
MNWKLPAFVLLACIATPHLLSAQQKDTSLVQLSGLVLDGTTSQLAPVPYTSIYVEGSNRGTYSDFKGFFSIVIRKSETVTFSAIGYKTVSYKLPADLQDDRYSVVQLMTQDTINLPETVVFPWPSRENFRLEFLAMDVTPELQRVAATNLAKEARARAQETVKYDGNENADYYMRKQASNYYYYGQRPPMNIFNPIAWKKFFDAWKNGDFKKKESSGY